MSMGGGGQMQELQQQLQLIDQEIEALRGEIQGFQDEKAEVDEAVEAIEALDDGDTVQVPLGGDAYVHAEVQDMERIVVGLGGGYSAERDEDGAKDSLKRKKELLDERIEEVREDIRNLEAEGDKLEQRAQQMQQQQLQQMQQQMQQQQQDDRDDE